MQLGQVQSQRMEQRLAPRMIQSMEILQLPIMDLQARVQQELQENPVLELTEKDADGQTTEASEESETPAPAEEPATPDPGERELNIDPQGDGGIEFDRLEAMNRDWENHFNEEHRLSRARLAEEGDRKHEAMQNMADRPPSLRDYLSEQATFLDCTAKELELVRYLISFVDDRGYIVKVEEIEEPGEHRSRRRKYVTKPMELEELANSHEPPVTVPEIQDALNLLQKLEPPGVGARTLQECLLLQITPDMPHRELVRTLIQNHLEDIEHNRMPVIQRKTGCDLDLIHEALDVIRTLNPRPGAQFTPSVTNFVTPDIIVDKDETGAYTVKLVDDWIPSICISPRYIQMYRDRGSDPKAREYLKQKLQSAQWLIESIEQRRHTLEKVTRAIIQHQKAFLDEGPELIRPLKMQQIADQVGVHVTTVSRAVDDKWVQTPRGLFPLKRFFGGGTEDDVAYETIKQKLLEVIAKEDKANPLSDEDLVAKLQELHYNLARRTVTKYRKMLNIPSSRERKDWGLAEKQAEKAAHVLHDHSPLAPITEEPQAHSPEPLASDGDDHEAATAPEPAPMHPETV
jgi:RNA polymerase sigma-54 factor